MKRMLQLGVLGLLTSAAVVTAPWAMSSVQAQTAATSRLTQELNLTSDQQTQIDSILQDRQSQIDGILTTDQQQQFQDALRSSHNLQTAVNSVTGLTDSQKSSVQSAIQTSRQAIANVLTQDQLNQLQSIKQSHHQQNMAQ